MPPNITTKSEFEDFNARLNPLGIVSFMFSTIFSLIFSGLIFLISLRVLSDDLPSEMIISIFS